VVGGAGVDVVPGQDAVEHRTEVVVDVLGRAQHLLHPVLQFGGDPLPVGSGQRPVRVIRRAHWRPAVIDDRPVIPEGKAVRCRETFCFLHTV
jgi:hypothetical protein